MAPGSNSRPRLLMVSHNGIVMRISEKASAGSGAGPAMLRRRPGGQPPAGVLRPALRELRAPPGQSLFSEIGIRGRNTRYIDWFAQDLHLIPSFPAAALPDTRPV